MEKIKWKKWAQRYPNQDGDGVLFCQGLELAESGIAVQRYFTWLRPGCEFDPTRFNPRQGFNRIVHIPTGLRIVGYGFDTITEAKTAALKYAAIRDWTTLDTKDKGMMDETYKALVQAGLR